MFLLHETSLILKVLIFCEILILELPMETDSKTENEESDGWQVVKRSKKR